MPGSRRSPLIGLAVATMATMLVTPANAQDGNGFYTGPAHPDWQRYVESSASQLDYPVHVVSTSGSVRDPDALLHNGTGTTTLTGTGAGIILDYGKDVGGVPEFGIAAETITFAALDELVAQHARRGNRVAVTARGVA